MLPVGFSLDMNGHLINVAPLINKLHMCAEYMYMYVSAYVCLQLYQIPVFTVEELLCRSRH